MRLVPRSSTGRLCLALGASIAGHALLVILACLLFTSLRPSATARDGVVERRIEAPEGYAPIKLSFAEVTPAPRAERVEKNPTPGPPDPPSSPPKKDSGANPGNGASAGNAAASDPPNDVRASGPPVVAPLHGKITAPGKSIVYVLDRSGSMGRDGKLTHAVAILKASLRQLDPAVRFQVVAYDSRSATLRIAGSPELVCATPANVRRAAEMLDELTGEGSSRHAEGLRAGLALRPDLLILLTDADELTSKDVQTVRKWNSKGTAIHAVLIGGHEDEQSRLKELTGPRRLHVVALPPPALTP